MKNRILLSLILGLIISGILLNPATAQASGYTVHLRRNFGFGAGSNIRGTFTISLIGPEAEVDSVTFLIDETPMATISSAPYQFKFHTDDFGFGTHRLSADVRLKDGTTQSTPVVQYLFVSPADEREQVTTVLVGIGGAIVVAMALVALIQMLLTKGTKPLPSEAGTPKRYGLLGGTICPKCGSPFSRHLFGMNLVVGRLDRCNYCGKWVMTVRASANALRAAEGNLPAADPGPGIEVDDRSEGGREAIEESKYFDEL